MKPTREACRACTTGYARPADGRGRACGHYDFGHPARLGTCRQHRSLRPGLTTKASRSEALLVQVKPSGDRPVLQPRQPHPGKGCHRAEPAAARPCRSSHWPRSPVGYSIATAEQAIKQETSTTENYARPLEAVPIHRSTASENPSQRRSHRFPNTDTCSKNLPHGKFQKVG